MFLGLMYHSTSFNVSFRATPDIRPVSAICHDLVRVKKKNPTHPNAFFCMYLVLNCVVWIRCDGPLAPINLFMEI